MQGQIPHWTAYSFIHCMKFEKIQEKLGWKSHRKQIWHAIGKVNKWEKKMLRAIDGQIVWIVHANKSPPTARKAVYPTLHQGDSWAG